MNNKPNIDYGKIPPQSIELEEIVLGCILLDSDTFFDISNILTTEMFYKSANSIIYSAICKLSNDYKPVDTLTITEFLRNKNELELVGGVFYLTNLSGKISNTKNIEEYALIINQKYLARELIRTSSEITTQSYDDTNDISDVLDFAYVQFDNINNSTLHGRTNTFAENVKNSLDDYEKRVLNKKEGIQSFIPTGLGALNKIMIGWVPGLTILAARPSIGKTAIALFFAKEAAKNNFNVDIFSLEMSSQKITDRMILGETDINPQEYKKGENVSWDQLEKATQKIQGYEIMINDEMEISINYIRSIIRKRFKQNKLGLVIIDYLQLMEGTDKSNKNNEVGSVTRALKKLTQLYDFPIILLSQLSRDIEKRGNGRHKLSDLRDSGNIEQDADDVLFISRERYDNEGNEIDLNIEENRKIYLDIAKHREGGLGLVTCYCNLYMNRFYEKTYYLDPDSQLEPNNDFLS